MSNDKYDRQKRLWGEGQVLINNARIICFGSCALASEALKNIVLSGVGFISIVDDKICSEKDLKENFFVERADITDKTLRAKAVLELILELNEDCKGEFSNYSIKDFLENEGIKLQTFDIILSSNNNQEENLALNEACSKYSKRLVIINQFGLINYLRLYENFHANMKLNDNDKTIRDTRVANPFKELSDFSMGFDLEAMTEIDHKHVPYVVLLVKALEKFKEKHERNPNNNQTDKKEFKEIVLSMKKFMDEENFDQAIYFVYDVTNDYLNDQYTEELKAIFDILDKHNLKELIHESSAIMGAFFIVTKALQLFYKKQNEFPVVGTLDDMVSKTETYVELRRLYEKKSKEDREALKSLVDQTLSDLKLNHVREHSISSYLSGGEVNVFETISKNYKQMSLNIYKELKAEIENPDFTTVQDSLYDEAELTNFIWYLLIKSAEIFNSEHKRFPGEALTHENFETDILLLKKSFEKFLAKNNNKEKLEEIGFNCIIEEKYFHEFCRNSNSCVVPACSMLGSMASQEIIKMITYQFKAVEHTVIFDAIHCTTTMFKI